MVSIFFLCHTLKLNWKVVVPRSVPRDIHAGLGVATSSTTGSGDIGSPENRMELQCAASRQIFLSYCSQSSLIKMAVWKAPFIPGFGECLDKCGCWSSLRASQEQKNLVGKRQRKTIRKHKNLECRVAKEATQLNVSIEGCLDVLTGLGLLDTHFSSWLQQKPLVYHVRVWKLRLPVRG